jgi:hypothetical protein
MSRIVLVAALVAISAMGVAAALLLTGDAALERLGIVIAFLGTIVAILGTALRADAAAISTDKTSSIAQALNGGFEARVRHANRETAAETGTRQDANRAEADARTAAALSSENGDPPDPPVRAG